MKRIIALVSLVAGLSFLAVAVEVERRWSSPLDIPPDGIRLEVTPGDSLRTVSNNLHEQGVLPYPILTRLYGRWSGLDQQIKRGEYRLAPGMTIALLLQKLQEGRVVQYRVTLPEGITLARALEILAAESQLVSVLSGADDAQIAELVQPWPVAEGLFFPDSYHFEAGSTDLELMRRAHRDMLSILQQEWEQRESNLPYETAYEALVMASIIERETGLPSERGQIAGVFVRRLQKGMRLQTDPTVIYGLGANFDGNLRRVHLRDEANPYNTYRHRGLPPSPISLPGRASIRAALNPEKGETLYFVARGDGGHVFSKTLAEHEEAVRKYQLQRRADYRSSPGNNQ